jgi:hypothetical protein
MLKKLLKYDLRAIFRIWWVAAVVSVAISFAGGYAWSFDGKTQLPQIISSCAAIVRTLSLCSAISLPIICMVLLFIRFYKNFFSDEGYLTFTLPVKRQTLLNSKVIAGFLAMAASAGVCFLDMLIMATVSTIINMTSTELQTDIDEFISGRTEAEVGLLPVHILEYILIGLMLLMLSVLFLYCCISFGSMIVKKGKLMASIGIFYGAHSLFGTIAMLFLIFGIGSINFWLSPLSDRAKDNLLALVYLGIIFFLAMLCALLYAIQHWILGKKLNLS